MLEKLIIKSLKVHELKTLWDNLCYKYCGNRSTSNCIDCEIYKIIKNLAYYKNLEEQGKLLILPCKPGDKVYAIKKRFSVCKYGRRWNINCEEGCPYDNYSGCDSKSEYYIETQVMNTVRNIVIMMNKLGKTVFLTESEAQKALEVVTINGQL